MGFRFRKSIKLAPGIQLNLSKSGGSLSLGGRGATVNLSNRGVKTTVGLPGTGASWTTRHGATGHRPAGIRTPHEPSPPLADTAPSASSYPQPTMKELREAQLQANAQSVAVEREQYQRMLRAWRHMPRVATVGEWEARLSPEPFPDQTPPVDPDYDAAKQRLASSIRSELESSARPTALTHAVRFFLRTVTGASLGFLVFLVLAVASRNDEMSGGQAALYFAFVLATTGAGYFTSGWYLRRRTRTRIDNSLANRIAAEWPQAQLDLQQATAKQQAAFAADDQDARVRWEELDRERIERTRALLDGIPEPIAGALEVALQQIEVPYEMSASVAVPDASDCHINLDLPEIEDVVAETEKRALKSGEIRHKKRKKSDVYQDYSKVAIGLGFHVVGRALATSPTVQVVYVAAHTQRVSKRTGNVEDQYVYVLRCDRETFLGLNFERLDPVEALQNFEHTIKRRATGHLDTIAAPDWSQPS